MGKRELERMAKLVGGVYRKHLPPPAIPFSAPEGRQIFGEALADGTADIFFPLIEQFQTQEEPAMCGAATLVVVLNALRVDPGEIWKAHWRWYHEANLSCCKSVEAMSKDGLEWREFLCLARCQGLKVEAVRADVGTLEEFEERCASVCSGSGGAVTVSYSRRPLRQAGDGHYAPIGAYNKRRSMVLVLDTARFKYPPHWLLVSDLWEAMRATNKQTGRSRGYAILTLPSISRSSVHLNLSGRAWGNVLKSLATEFPAVADELTPEAELWVFVRGMPPPVAALVSVSELDAGQTAGEPENQSRSAAVIRALRQTECYRTLAKLSAENPYKTLPNSLENLTFVMLLLGGMGLLDSMLRSKEARIWVVEVDTSSDEDTLILAEELSSLRRAAEEIREEVAQAPPGSRSCCDFEDMDADCCKTTCCTDN